MTTTPEQTATGDIVGDLPDLTEVPLAVLRGQGGSTLERAIRRIMQEAERPDEAIAGFNSSI